MIKLSCCILCNEGNFEEYLKCKDFTTSLQLFTIKKCKNCGFEFTDPQPNESEIGKYYLSEKYISHTGSKRNLFELIYHISRRSSLISKWNIIKKNSHGKTILDFGCGTGEFLKEMKRHSWKISGVEPAEIANSKAAEITKEKIYQNISEITSKETFDVITLWHVLEHLHNPHQIIVSLSKLLRKDGIIIIAVPNRESYDANYYKSYWAAYDVPRHLWHFSKSDLTNLLKNTGFNVAKILPMKLDSYYVSLLSESNRKSTSKILIPFMAFYRGLVSNLKARKNMNYSSLIYIAKR